MNTYRAGIDIGSTTVKLVVLDEQDYMLYGDYRRHHAHTQQELGALLGRSGDQIGAVIDDAAAGGLFQQVQAPQEGGLAAAGGANDGHHLTGLDLNIYALEDLVLAEGLSQALNADHAHFSYPRK